MSTTKKANKSGLQQKMFNKSVKILFYWCKGYRFFPHFLLPQLTERNQGIKTLIGAISKSHTREAKSSLFIKSDLRTFFSIGSKVSDQNFIMYQFTISSHFLYRFLDGKKTTRSQFSVTGLRETHRKLKQEKK